jgi:uncharacterized protein
MKKLDKNFLEEEIYKIPRPDGTLVYAPLTRSFLFSEEKSDQFHPPDDWIKDAISTNNVPQFVIDSLFNNTDKTIRLRLNVTNGCNLHCEYCSVVAQKTYRTDMDFEMAKKNILFFLDECSKSDKKLEITISGGEPTIVGSLLEKIVSFTKKEADIRKIQISTKLLTNGVFNQVTKEILIDNFDSVQVSWDGDAPNNPRYGKKTQNSNVVRRNIVRLVDQGMPVSLLTVVSEYNQKQLVEIVDDVYENMHVDSHFLSMRDSVGRAINHKSLDYDFISESYLNLWKKYRILGYDVNLTGTNIHAISKFPCAVAAPNYSVSPTGEISACTIAFNNPSITSLPFNIGNIEKEVPLKKEKISKLQIYSVENKSECKSCFAKWHCRGGCPYAFEKGMANNDPQRCDLVRNVVAEKLLWIIENE